MITDYDKVLVRRDEKGNATVIIVQEQNTHVPTFYKVEKLTMDDIKSLFDGE